MCSRLSSGALAAVIAISVLGCTMTKSDESSAADEAGATATGVLGVHAPPDEAAPTGHAGATAPASLQSVRLTEAAWVRDQAVPFDTVEAGSGFVDLAPLEAMIGDARIVSLGECTHGTREFFQMKHRLTEFLASEMGFTIFAIEANMPEAYRINDYVLGGDGDPKALIGGMYFWTWNTEEVLAMVEWMREFNASSSGRIEFAGFDMQTPNVAMDIVRRFVADVDPDYAAELANAYQGLESAQLGSSAEFGLAIGTFPADEAAGKQVRFDGFIKTEGNKDGQAGLWWRVDGVNGEAIASDSSMDRGPAGTTPWTHHEIELDVPEEASNISFGVFMTGDGTAWFDTLRIRLDDVEYRASEEQNLDFEAEEAGWLWAPPRKGYVTGPDDQEANTGAHSLRIQSAAPKPDAGVQQVSIDQAVEQAQRVLDHLTESRDRYLSVAADREADWAIQNARVVAQGVRMRAEKGHVARDASMADNIAWIADQNPDAKIVIWAHNGHVARIRRQMGAHLAERFESDYLPVAFATFEGEYYAMGADGPVHTLQSPPKGSAEDILHDSGLARLILDLRSAEPGSEESGWVAHAAPFRTIGSMALAEQFQSYSLASSFDLLVFIDRTQAAVQLDTRPGRAQP